MTKVGRTILYKQECCPDTSGKSMRDMKCTSFGGSKIDIYNLFTSYNEIKQILTLIVICLQVRGFRRI